MKIVKLLRMGALLAAAIAFVGCEMTLNDEDSRKEVVEAKAKANADKGSGNGNGGGSGESQIEKTQTGINGTYTAVAKKDWSAGAAGTMDLTSFDTSKGVALSFKIENTTTDQTCVFQADGNIQICAGYVWLSDELGGAFYEGDNTITGNTWEKAIGSHYETLCFNTDGSVDWYLDGVLTFNWTGKTKQVENLFKALKAGVVNILPQTNSTTDVTVSKISYSSALTAAEAKSLYDKSTGTSSATPGTDNSSQAENSGNNNNSGNNGNNDSGNNGNNDSGNTENGQNGGTEKTVASIAITNASLKYDFYNPAAYTEIINSTSLTKAIDFTVTATYSDNTTGSLAASGCTFAVTGTNVTATYNSLTSPAYALPAPTYIISEATTVTDSNAMKSSSDAVLAKGKTSAALFTAKNADDNTYNVWVEIWGNSGVTMRMDNWAWNYGWDGAVAGSGLTIGATEGGDADKKSIVASESDWVTALKTKLTSGYKVLAVIENGNSDVNVTLTSPEWAGWKQTYKLSKASDTANGEVRFHFNTGAANSSIAFQ
ncbi:MAG: hypothetical protein IJJ71_10445 [Treponema sp.]|uniref:hypothetical protein n=1 Tax=Treponema sp. TaxID=166 RepID=UPI0025DA132F|nr:hypothetical protein [Treponema sp.]MBR0496579.1 hypothetical protein [Treponema sp.]